MVEELSQIASLHFVHQSTVLEQRSHFLLCVLLGQRKLLENDAQERARIDFGTQQLNAADQIGEALSDFTLAESMFGRWTGKQIDAGTQLG